jgi:hypothetical protein
MILGPCQVCGRDVESMHPHAYRVAGWEAVRRGGGGANRIIDRLRLGAVAHTMCVEQRASRRRRGVADGQQVLS